MTSSSSASPPSDLRSQLASGDKRRRSILITVGAILGAAAIAVASFFAGTVYASPSGDSASPGANAGGAGEAEDAEPISISIAGSGESDFQDTIKLVAAEKGLDITWVNFDDWVLPNSALVAGEVDANAFQHIAFLSAFNVANDADLTPVLSTVITQWGIFSATIDSLDEIDEGARIAIPDDASNGARALFILDDAGLISLGDDVGIYPTVDDIVGNPLDLELVAIGATTIPTQFDDPSLTAVVVGTGYFDPSQEISAEDALFLDDSLAEGSLPYVNVIATRTDNIDNPAWEILSEVYADPRVAQTLLEESFGNTVLVDTPVDGLRERLAELEELARSLS